MLDTLRRLSARLDPGLQRTMAASRTTLAVAAALLIALPLTRALGMPMPLAILAIAAAMNTSIVLFAPSRAHRLRTLGVAMAITLATVGLGLLVRQHPLVSQTVFVVIMGLGAWAGGFGPQGMMLGMLAFQSYFITIFTQLPPSELPWVLAAAAMGTLIGGASALVVFMSPRRRLRHLIAALREHVAMLHADAVTADGGARAVRAGGQIRRVATAVDDILVQIHEVLAEARGVVDDEQAFHRRLFAVVTLTHYLLLEVETPDADLTALHPPPSDPLERLELHLDALERLARGERVTASAAEGAAWLRESDVPREEYPAPAAMAAPSPPPPSRWRPAVQAIGAGVLAIAAGLVVDPERWYWAALTAFVVLLNTPSRGATLRKAAERVLGTVIGAVAGLAAGALLARQTALELLAILPLVFAAFWLMQVSYAAMVATFTVLVALLYEMQGMLTVDVMKHRLIDTLVGAAAGVLVAHLVLPARTRAVVDSAFRHYLDALRGLRVALDHAASLPPGRADALILQAARTLDQSVGALRRTLQPLAWSVASHRRRLRHQMALALAARFWMHRAAARVMFHPAAGTDVDAEEMTALERAQGLVGELEEARRG